MAQKDQYANAVVAGGVAEVTTDPRDETKEPEADHTKKTADEKLVEWVIGRVRQWKDHRVANYDSNWNMYERLWRAIYSDEDKTKKRERGKIISPALSEAVENGAAEIEEAVFGRGDFFDLWPEAGDSPPDRKVLEHNETLFRQDLDRTDFTGQCSEIIINGAVFGTGIGEIVLCQTTDRDITLEQVTDPKTQEATTRPSVIEKEVERPEMRSVNPRNFIIDPSASCIEKALGCAIEEDVGAHIIREGIQKGYYKKNAKIEAASGDVNVKADPQVENPWIHDVVPIIRYYGKVPKQLLFPPEKVEELFSDSPEKSTEPVDAEMVEALVVISNEEHLLKAIETPDRMKDRPGVAYQWDIVPGKFWGRGLCEKGSTPQKLLDAELRARIEALAYVAAPLMAMDATKLPRGFKFEVYPGKNLLLSGDPSTILKPFKFGELDQNSGAQVQLLDQMVQRATGSIDTTALAQGGVSGQARSGAVSMALAPIVKRNKRTLMRYVNRFLTPALRKLMWRYMQYDSPRYIPANMTFNVSSTMGIMQREYESANLAQMLSAMQPGTTEHMVILLGLIGNSGVSNRDRIMAALEQKLAKVQQAESMPPVDPTAVTDPVIIQMQRMDAQLELATKQVKIAETQAKTRLYNAQANSEAVGPALESQKIALKGIYKTPEEQIDEEFDRRMKVAELKLKAADIASNERITDRQTSASERVALIDAQAAAAATPAPAPAPKPQPTGPISVAIGPTATNG
jgi:hypothetical protein